MLALEVVIAQGEVIRAVTRAMKRSAGYNLPTLMVGSEGTFGVIAEVSCTGEHLLGLHKMNFLRYEAGDSAVQMMRTIKRALDPDNIMNPVKIFAWCGVCTRD